MKRSEQSIAEKTSICMLDFYPAIIFHLLEYIYIKEKKFIDKLLFLLCSISFFRPYYFKLIFLDL